MERSARRNLLPGVRCAASPPEVIYDSRRVVRRARRRAALRDSFNILLLAGVDYLFHHWPHAHIPLLGRHDSLRILVGVNVGAVACLWGMRMLPGWYARRIAATWHPQERGRFLASL